ncbi:MULTISPECIES: DarT ssDNA thymidine ADP-ribosyltransferase family protein [Aeromonas]
MREMEIILWIIAFFFIIGLFSSGNNGENDKIKSSKSRANQKPNLDNNKSNRIGISSVLGTARDGLDTFNAVVEKMHDYVHLENEVQRSLSSLKDAISFERTIIITSLESAERELLIESKFANDPQGKKRFDEFFDDLATLIEVDSTPKQPYKPHQCIDLIYKGAPHPNPEIEAAIKSSFEHMIEEHIELLNKITHNFKQKPRLRVLFDEKLKKWMPDVLKRIQCFEGGGEWRYVRSFREIKGIGTSRFNFGDLLSQISSHTNSIQIEISDNHTTSKPIKYPPPAYVDENKLLWQKTVKFLTRKNNENHNEIKQDIKNIVMEREIPFLLHFTQVTNLSSILKHGLYSIDKTKECGITPNINDYLRLDNRLNGISVSIAYPNAKMLYKYRIENPNVDWAIIAIDPSILWMKDCAFCKKNAATKYIRDLPTSQLKTSQALKSMFDDINDFNSSSRKKQYLYPCDPTDVQAEVLIFDIIEPEYINAIIFENDKQNNSFSLSFFTEEYATFVSGNGIVDFFSPRTDVRKNKISF